MISISRISSPRESDEGPKVGFVHDSPGCQPEQDLHFNKLEGPGDYLDKKNNMRRKERSSFRLKQEGKMGRGKDNDGSPTLSGNYQKSAPNAGRLLGQLYG